jgi:hemolysin III
MDQTASLSLDGPPPLEAALPEARGDALPIAPETANQLTHACGLVLSAWGATYMMGSVAGEFASPRFFACLVYVASLVAIYAASTLSHSFTEPGKRELYRMLDQICIFLSMPAHFMLFSLVHLQHGAWPWLTAAMWVFAATGVALRVRSGTASVATALYLLVGWVPVLALGAMYEAGGAAGLGLILAGALAYTGGTWFLSNDHRHPYLHAVWHVCTIVGSTFHFLFLQWYVAEWVA